MADLDLPYDKHSKESILNYARHLLGKSLWKLHPEARLIQTGKGGLGNAVEKFHFKYDPNSKSEADFAEAGIELKCTPLKRLPDGSMVSKERLVLNMIDYVEESKKSFYESSFWKKNELLLLMFYLHEELKLPFDVLFKIIRLWKFPETDLKIIKDDWTVIHNKIIAGKAHELSEGDTFYLAACTKGSKAGAEMREQPYSAEKAPQRAYSIKSKYINSIILDSLKHPEMFSDVFMSDKQRKKIEKTLSDTESVVRDVKDYQEGETFEQLIERKFSKFYGKTIAEIETELNVNFGLAKSMAYNVCRAILGVKANKIAEFEKAGIAIKTIRLEQNGKLKEAMSFPNVNYKEIVEEDCWENSALYGMFTQRFLFVIFRKPEIKNDKEVRLEKVIFWTMPTKDLEQGRILWVDTQLKVQLGDYEHFMRMAENPVCHIRPKAQNAADTTESAQGNQVKKMCYWLNSAYVKRMLMNSDLSDAKVPVLCLKESLKMETEILFPSSVQQRRQKTIRELELSVRAYNGLIQNGVKTIGELLQQDEKKLHSFKNVGKKTIDELIEMIQRERELEKLADGFPTCKVAYDESWKKTVAWSVLGEENYANLLIVDGCGDAIPDISIDYLCLSFRACNSLKNAGIQWFSELIRMPIDDFFEIENLGKKSYDEIFETIKLHIIFAKDEIMPESIEESDIDFLVQDFQIAFYQQQIEKIKKRAFQFLLKRQRKIEQTDNILFEFLDEEFFVELFIEGLKRKIRKKILCTEEDFKEVFPSRLSKLHTRIVAKALMRRDIEIIYGRYGLVMPSFKEYVLSYSDETRRKIITDCANGKTFRQCGNDLGISHERVRQIINQFMQKIPLVKEECQIHYLSNYDISEHDIGDIFALDEFGRFYVKKIFSSGNKPLEEILSDENVPNCIRALIERFLHRNLINVDGQFIQRNREQIFNFVIKHYCKEYTTEDELRQRYSLFLKRYVGTEDKRLECYDACGLKLAKNKNCLCVLGDKFRYYEITDSDFNELLKSIDFFSLQNIEISTRYFTSRFAEELRAFDIHDEYELHNLFRKKMEGWPEISILRMPCIKIGSCSRKEQVYNLLQQESPISYGALAEKYEELYGVRQSVFNTVYAPLVQRFLFNGEYSYDNAYPNENEYEYLISYLTENLVDFSKLKIEFSRKFSSVRLNVLNAFSLKNLGYRIVSNLLFRTTDESFESFFLKNVLNGEVVDFSNQDWLWSNHCVSFLMYRLKKDYEWFEYEPRKYISLSKLKEMITGAEEMGDYAEKAIAFSKGHCFSIASLKKCGFDHPLHRLGFGDYFYESFLKYCSLVKYVKIGGGCIFAGATDLLSTWSPIMDVVEEYRQISIYDLIEIIKNRYNVDLNKQKMVELADLADIYYSETMEKIYINYEEFLGDL